MAIIRGLKNAARIGLSPIRGANAALDATGGVIESAVRGANNVLNPGSRMAAGQMNDAVEGLGSIVNRGNPFTSLGDDLARAGDSISRVKNKTPIIKNLETPQSGLFVNDAKNGQNIYNAWTGKRLNPYAVAPVVGGALAWQGAREMFDSNPAVSNLRFAQEQGIEDSGPAERMMYDGVGAPQRAPDLGASGDLVFGMHNSRKRR